jgi:3-methyladenine DNA glycosylase AlkC
MPNNSVDITGSIIQGNFVQGENSGNISAIFSNVDNQHVESKAVAVEIQQILDDISKKNPGKDVAIQMKIAVATIQAVEENKSLKQKVISALKAGGTAAIGQFLNHPAASFVIAVLEDWNNS